jgi:hypothetical protein
MTYMPATLLLMSETITAAQSASTKTAVAGLARAKSLAIQYNFTYGSGGTSFTAWVQTSFDGGTTWVDIANCAGTTSSIRRCYNLTSNTAVTTIYTPTDGTLTDNTAKDGLIGDQLRVKFTSVGTYAGSTTMVVSVIAKD